MDHQPGIATPNASKVLKFFALTVWRSKWLTGLATIVVILLTFALAPANTRDVWSGREKLRIGLAPSTEYIVLATGAALTPIDTQRGVAALISDPDFRQRVTSSAAFEPATAAASRSMVMSSLRAVVLDGDREIAIELNATSSADVQAAFRAVATEINKVHGAILDRRLALLQNRIESSRNRIEAIEKASNQLDGRILSGAFNQAPTERPPIFMPVLAASIPAWSNLQDRIDQDSNLKALSEPSAFRPEWEDRITGSHSVQTLKFSLLAGFAMLLAMIVLTMIVSRPTATSEDRDNGRSIR
jgi:hypothetical protein